MAERLRKRKTEHCVTGEIKYLATIDAQTEIQILN